MLETFKNVPLSIVSDSYDLWNFIDMIIGTEVKDIIMDRKMPFVVRPDSGDPKETLIKTLDKLAVHFAPNLNGKGFKVLPDYIRVIQGTIF